MKAINTLELTEDIIKSQLAPHGGNPPRPRKEIITREEMAATIACGEHLVLRKYDGELAVVNLGPGYFICELVTPKSGGFYTESDRALFDRHGGFYAALTLGGYDTNCLLDQDTILRWERLQEYFEDQAEYFSRCTQSGWPVILAEQVTNVAKAFSSGAEGICAYHWYESWGNMLCTKVNTIYECKVTKIGASQSVEICDIGTNEILGAIKLGGGKCDKVRVGSIIRVEAMGQHESGKLRQPTPCREWLKRY